MTTKTNVNTVILPIDSILADEDFNIRKNITVSSVATLAESIKAEGLQSPITVIKTTTVDDNKIRYKVITGHRRFAACKAIGLKEIPCFVKENLDRSTIRVLNIIENTERVQVDIMAEAEGCRELAAIGHTVKEIAKRLNQGTRWVSVRLGLLQLPKKVQELASLGLLSSRQLESLIEQYDSGFSEEDLLKAAESYEYKRQAAEKEKKHIYLEKKSKINLNPNAEDEDNFKIRSKAEILNLLQIVHYALRGESLASVALQFVLSRATHADVLRAVKEEADLLGISYAIPPHYIDCEHFEKERLGLK